MKCLLLTKKAINFSGLVCLFLLASCESEFTPKPRGYMRIDFPKKEYQTFDSAYPYIFQIPTYASVVAYRGAQQQKYWSNIYFAKYKATIHLSYFSIENNLEMLTEDSRKLAYKHTVKAENIDETPVYFPENSIYGMVYSIGGNTASNTQFYATDSVNHFLRGALYFNAAPNKDSLEPVVNFIQKDIVNLLQSLRWKKGFKN